MGCALLLPLGNAADGASVAEVGAFCVSPVFRCAGQGDAAMGSRLSSTDHAMGPQCPSSGPHYAHGSPSFLPFPVRLTFPARMPLMIYRGSGRGDSMLDYAEQEARRLGIRRLVLLTTRTADWFEQRDFVYSGHASESRGFLPEARRAKINPARNSQLYVKELEKSEGKVPRPGKQIGV